MLWEYSCGDRLAAVQQKEEGEGDRRSDGGAKGGNAANVKAVLTGKAPRR